MSARAILFVILAVATPGCGPRSASSPPAVPPEVWSPPEAIGVASFSDHLNAFRLSLAPDGLSACVAWSARSGSEATGMVTRWLEPVGWSTISLGASDLLPDCAAAAGRRDFALWAAATRRPPTDSPAYVRQLPDEESETATVVDDDWGRSTLRLVVQPSQEPAVVWAAHGREIGYSWRGAAGWNVERVATAARPESVHSPEVTVGDDGSAFVVWEKRRDGRQSGPGVGEIVVRRRDASGSWDDERTIGLSNRCCVLPQIGGDAAGRATVLWSVTDEVEVTIWVAHYEPGSGWTAAQKLATDPEPFADAPALAVSAGGDALAAWSEATNAEHGVRAARYRPGEGWTAPEWIGNAFGNELSPRVAANAHGQFRVLWKDHKAARLWSRALDQGRWGPIEGIGDGGAPVDIQDWRIAIDGTGRALAVWIPSGPAYKGEMLAIWRSAP